VVQKLSHDDSPAVAQSAGQVPLDGVSEGEAAFARKPEDHGRDKRLGGARDPEPISRLCRALPFGVAGRALPDAFVRLDKCHGAGALLPRQLPKRPLKVGPLARRRSRLGVVRCASRPGNDDRQQCNAANEHDVRRTRHAVNTGPR
jgi:hypothetical protein